MAYTHYGFGQTEQTAAPKPPDGFTTDISTAYITPSEQSAAPLPSPTDIVPKPDLVDTWGPAPPIVPMPAMTTPLTPMGPTSSTQTARPVSSEGLFGIQWKWWLIGGVVVWFGRRYFASDKKVAPNRRHGRRRRR